VARFDHHCMWLNICVGGDNYGLFILLLLTVIAMSYNGVLTCWAASSAVTSQLTYMKYVDASGAKHQLTGIALIQVSREI